LSSSSLNDTEDDAGTEEVMNAEGEADASAIVQTFSFSHLNDAEEKAKMLRGELYHAFVPSLVAERARCSAACYAFNAAYCLTRLERANLWNA